MGPDRFAQGLDCPVCGATATVIDESGVDGVSYSVFPMPSFDLRRGCIPEFEKVDRGRVCDGWLDVANAKGGTSTKLKWHIAWFLSNHL